MDIKEVSAEIDVLTGSGCSHLEKSNLEKAIKYFLRACNVAESLQKEVKSFQTASLVITTSINLSGAFLATRNIEKAFKYLDRAYDLCKDGSVSTVISPFYKSDICINYASAYELKKDWATSRSWMEKAIEISQSILKGKCNNEITEDNIKDLKDLNLNLQKKYALLTEFCKLTPLEVSKSWQSVADLAVENRTKCSVILGVNRAIFWSTRQTDETKVLESLSWAISILKNVPPSPEKGSLLNDIGLSYMSFGSEPAKAVEAFREALKCAKTMQKDIKASILQNIGAAQVSMKQYDDAIVSLGKSCLLYGEADSRAGQCQAGCNLAYAFAATGRWKQARWHYALSREAANDAGLVSVQLQTEEALAALELKRERPDKAVKHLKAAIGLCPALAANEALANSKSQSGSATISSFKVSTTPSAVVLSPRGQQKLAADKLGQQPSSSSDSVHEGTTPKSLPGASPALRVPSHSLQECRDLWGSAALSHMHDTPNGASSDVDAKDLPPLANRHPANDCTMPAKSRRANYSASSSATELTNGSRPVPVSQLDAGKHQQRLIAKLSEVMRLQLVTEASAQVAATPIPSEVSCSSSPVASTSGEAVAPWTTAENVGDADSRRKVWQSKDELKRQTHTDATSAAGSTDENGSREDPEISTARGRLSDTGGTTDVKDAKLALFQSILGSTDNDPGSGEPTPKNMDSERELPVQSGVNRSAEPTVVAEKVPTWPRVPTSSLDSGDRIPPVKKDSDAGQQGVVAANLPVIGGDHDGKALNELIKSMRDGDMTEEQIGERLLATSDAESEEKLMRLTLLNEEVDQLSKRIIERIRGKQKLQRPTQSGDTNNSKSERKRATDGETDDGSQAAETGHPATGQSENDTPKPRQRTANIAKSACCTPSN